MSGVMLQRGRHVFDDPYLTSVCLAALATVVVAVAMGGLALLTPTALAVAVALVATTPAPLLTHSRGDTIAVTVEEVFLVPALVLLSAPAVIVVTAIGVGAGMTVGSRWSAPWARHRYFSPRRIVFNAGQKTASAGVAAVVFAAIGPPQATGPSIAAATAAAGVYALTSRGLVAGIIARLSERRYRDVLTDDVRRFLGFSLLLWGAGALLALAVLTLGAPALWIGLTVTATLVGSAVTNRSALRHERTEGLLEATRRISAAGTDLDGVQAELEASARELMDCHEAALQDAPPPPGGASLGIEVTPGTWLTVSVPRGTDVGEFEAADRSALEALATIAAPALERARAMAKLRMADDLKAAVIASVSHDIRTPLFSAMGIADLLRDAPDLPAEQRAGLVDRLRSAVGRLARLVEGMLDLERYELGQLPEPADADVREVADRVVADITDADTAPVVLEIEDGCRARIDRSALERVLENLVANALRHGPDGAAVVVTAAQQGGAVHLCVSDAGPGVAEERRQEIFEPFRSSDGSPGVGLGLWVTRRFVELRGGRVWVDRSELGGAAFHVELPSA